MNQVDFSAIVEWTERQPQLAGIVLTAIIGPIVVILANRLFASTERAAEAIKPPEPGMTSELRIALTELGALERKLRRDTEEIIDRLGTIQRAQDQHTVYLVEIDARGRMLMRRLDSD